MKDFNYDNNIDRLFEQEDAEITALTERVRELQIARIGDAEIIGRWMCESEKYRAENKMLREALGWIKEVAFNYSRSHLHVAGNIYEIAKAALEQKEGC